MASHLPGAWNAATFLQIRQVQPPSGPAAPADHQGSTTAHEGQTPPGGSPEAKPEQPSALPSFLMLGAIFVLFYFIGIRPQQKQAKKHRELVSALRVGDKVVTGSGILGRIAQLDDKIVTLEVDKGTRIKVLRDHVQGLQQDAMPESDAKSGRKKGS